MEERGSKTGFAIGFIFGMIFMLIGIAVAGFVIYKIMQIQKSGDFPESKVPYFVAIAAGFYITIVNVWVVAAAFWMMHFMRLKQGYITSITMGILSINPFAVLAGIAGMIDYNYLRKVNEPRVFGN